MGRRPLEEGVRVSKSGVPALDADETNWPARRTFLEHDCYGTLPSAREKPVSDPAWGIRECAMNKPTIEQKWRQQIEEVEIGP
jgi:hypothetical protein